MTPAISIIIPVKNEAADLPHALASIEGQDFPLDEVEVLVVDGDSTDGTAIVAKQVLSDMSIGRFDVLANPGGNTPSNLNRGLEWASGTYVVRVDARSQIPADYLRRTTGLLADRPEVGVTGGSQVAIRRENTFKAQAIEMALNNPLAMGGSRYRRAGALSGPADTVYLGVFRRSDLVEAGGWNEHFSTNQDFELNQRMARYGTVWFEADLPVSYLPRKNITDLVKQYHRFGRWKAHAWSSGGLRPNRRQKVLISAPVLLGTGFLAVVSSRRRSGIIGISVVLATLVNPLRSASLVLNAVIAGSWWSGVVRGLGRDSVSR